LGWWTEKISWVFGKIISGAGLGHPPSRPWTRATTPLDMSFLPLVVWSPDPLPSNRGHNRGVRVRLSGAPQNRNKLPAFYPWVGKCIQMDIFDPWEYFMEETQLCTIMKIVDQRIWMQAFKITDCQLQWPIQIQRPFMAQMWKGYV
jgi:hypothetical protein